MGIVLRVLLILGSFTVLLFVVRKIRRAQFDTNDSLFWLILSFGLLILALFPDISFFLSDLLGFQSPSNLIFLIIIALLLIRVFTLQVKLSQLQRKTTLLAQEIALNNTHPEQADKSIQE